MYTHACMKVCTCSHRKLRECTHTHTHSQSKTWRSCLSASFYVSFFCDQQRSSSTALLTKDVEDNSVLVDSETQQQKETIRSYLFIPNPKEGFYSVLTLISLTFFFKHLIIRNIFLMFILHLCNWSSNLLFLSQPWWIKRTASSFCGNFYHILRQSRFFIRPSSPD